MALKFTQKYIGDSPPLCEIECSNRAIALWQDESGLAFNLCANHAKELYAEEILEGAWYPSTHLPLPSWRYLQGKYIKNHP